MDFLLRGLFTLIFIINSIACIPPPKHCNDNSDYQPRLRLPEWFINKPQIDGIKLAFAYSPNYLNKKKEKENLLLSAARNFKIQSKTHIIVLQNSQKYSGYYSGGEYVNELDPEVNTNGLADKYSIISKYKDTNWILAIVAETQQVKQYPSIRMSTRLNYIYNSSPPKWAKNPPVQKGFLFGVGLALSYCSPEEAWIVAEQNARADIALQKTITIYSRISHTLQSFIGTAEVERKAVSKVILNNVFIIKHGYCDANGTYYALARMKEEDAALRKPD
jgi:hypothetical protein